MADNIPNLLSHLDVGDKVVLGLDVTDVGSNIRKFMWPDYLVFMGMLLICLIIGMYYAFFKKSTNSEDYLVGGRNMDTFPVAMSLIARWARNKNETKLLFYKFQLYKRNITVRNPNRSVCIWCPICIYCWWFFADGYRYVYRLFASFSWSKSHFNI